MGNLKRLLGINIQTIVITLALIGLLSLIAQVYYVFFHSIAESLFIITAALVYLLAAKTYKYSEDNYLLFIGIGYLFIAILHMLHFLTYKGMGLFPEPTENMPTQLWIAGRLLEACTFVLAPLFAGRKIRPLVLYMVYTFVTLGIFLTVITQIFPDCFIPGYGLTPFKIGAEYLAMLLLAFSLILLQSKKDDINPYARQIMTVASMFMILESLCFTLYTDVYGIMNFFGHILGILGTATIYRGIVIRGFELPYDLIFRQLVERHDELRRMSQYKSEFLANMSHEMRTPLTAVISLTDELLLERQGPLTEEQTESLREIRESSRELSNLINDLLDMSKIETDRMFLVLTEVDIGSVVCEVEKQLRPLALQHRLSISLVVTSELKVIADREKVRRVAQNIIFNAIKFTPDGGTIEVTVYDSQGETPGTILRVKDTGIGIPPKDQELIFQSFFTVEREMTKKFSGTGLGLALVKKIMDLHKGWIKLESKEGRGSTFEVFWPLYPPLDDELE